MTKSQLTIEVADQFVQFTSFQGDTVQQQAIIQINLSDESIRKEELSTCFEKNSFLSIDFDEISLSYVSKESSLVPNSIFAESTPDSIFKLCFGEPKEKYSVDFNRISELSIVNIYTIPDWLKRFFVLKFPRIIIQHEGTHGLRKILNSETFHLKVSLMFHTNYFCMTIVKHSNLEFYSFFDYQNDDDIIYHVLFALQQKELVNEKGILELIHGIDSNTKSFVDLKGKFKRIKELASLEVNEKNNFIAQSQLLCV